jgi:hypothetical protein
MALAALIRQQIVSRTFKGDVMSQSLNAKVVADAMFEMVVDHVEKKVKPLDLTRAMLEKYGKGCTRSIRNQALRLLVSPERCVYHSGHYIGGCYIMLANG